jgi:hypothetical protein
VKSILQSLVVIVSAASIAAQAVALPCGRDNTLYEDPNGAFSNALGESIFVGVTAQGRLRRALLWFDVAAALPAGARVLAAELELSIVFSPALADSTLFLHRPLLPWGEGSSYALGGGGGQGAPSTPGDATWTQAIHPVLPWATPGGDFVATPSAALVLPVAGSVRGFVAAAEVQDWLDQPATNLGWLLKNGEQTPADRARRLESRESPGTPPRLHVAYVASGTTTTYGTGCPLPGGPMATTFVGAPQAGATVGLRHDQLPPGSLGVTFYALDLDPVGTALAPACRLYLPLGGPLFPGDVFLADAAGLATATLALPPGASGALVVAQAAVLDTSALGLALGNAAALLVP